jgi:hypothetical protein
MIQLRGQQVALHQRQLVSHLVVVGLDFHQSIQVLLALIAILLPRRRRYELSTLLASSWIWLIVLPVFLNEDLPAIVLVSKLLVAHLDEHVVVDFVGSPTFKFSGDPVRRRLC